MQAVWQDCSNNPNPSIRPRVNSLPISDLAADQKAHERRAAMKSYLATVSAWIALATLWAADCLIQLMLRTRSNERTVRATKRVPWPKGLRQELMRRQGNRCVYCGCRLAVYNCEIDHMDPVIRGGSNDKDNLQVLCRPCNMRKGPQTDQEFRKRYARLVPRTRRRHPPNQCLTLHSMQRRSVPASPRTSSTSEKPVSYLPARKSSQGASPVAA